MICKRCGHDKPLDNYKAGRLTCLACMAELIWAKRHANLDARTSKRCSMCGTVLPLSAFGPRKGRYRGLTSRCRTCMGQIDHERRRGGVDRSGWKKREPITQREMNMRRYGLTIATYEAMLEAQGGLCAVCKRMANGRGKRLHVDHDHTTRRVRGLLCHNCNVALGMVSDDPELLRRLARYVETAT